jgi:hypothetical protein
MEVMTSQNTGLRLWKKNPEKGKLFDVLMVKVGEEQMEFMSPRRISQVFFFRNVSGTWGKTEEERGRGTGGKEVKDEGGKRGKREGRRREEGG